MLSDKSSHIMSNLGFSTRHGIFSTIIMWSQKKQQPQPQFFYFYLRAFVTFIFFIVYRIYSFVWFSYTCLYVSLLTSRTICTFGTNSICRWSIYSCFPPVLIGWLIRGLLLVELLWKLNRRTGTYSQNSKIMGFMLIWKSGYSIFPW